MQPPAAAQDGERIFASPMARRLAGEAGVPIAEIRGSGPGGRIVRRDVESFAQQPRPAAAAAPAPAAQPAAPAQAAAPAPAPAPEAAPVTAAGPGRREPLSRLRQTIARRLSQSKREVPHYYVTVAIDMTAALELRKQLNSMEGVKISVNDMVVKACALALKQFPTLNASFAEDSLIVHEQINMGIAIATDNGLLAPAIADVDKKSLGVLAAETRDLAERTRAGKATPDELGRGTFTVSNLGMYGVESFVAIINPPQAAIVAVGAATETPVVKDGQVVVAPIMKATISADHRVSDGVVGAQYLQAVKALLETPMRLLI
jgi:pyruvate dehydrogenase E2 component (dihydrolipoamide acetyltransferase)